MLAARHLAADEGRAAIERNREAQAELRALMAAVDDPEVRERLGSIAGTLRGAPAEPAARLSRREVDVLSLVALGGTYAEVGRRLGLSPVTVKTYMRDVIARLGVTNRHEAVVAARRLGVLLCPGPAGRHLHRGMVADVSGDTPWGAATDREGTP